MKNEYEVRGEVTAIIINSRKYGRFETLISTSKLELVKEFTGSWCVAWNKRTQLVYVIGTLFIKNKKPITVYLHRWLTNEPAGMQVDHFNHNTLDNTDSNLRVVTHAENQQNQKGAQTNSTSGVRGVFWHEKTKKWRVQIRINNVQKYIGLFDTIEEATLASIEARRKYMPFSIVV